MSDSDTSLVGALQHSVAQILVGYESDDQIPDGIYDTRSTEVPSSPSRVSPSRPSSPQHSDKEPLRHGSSSSQHPDKDPLSDDQSSSTYHTSPHSPLHSQSSSRARSSFPTEQLGAVTSKLSHTVEGIHAILQQMQASMGSYTSRISPLEKTEENKNEHIAHLAATTRALQENTRIAEKDDGEVKRSGDAVMQMTETEKVQRLEEANARLDGENKDLRNEVDVLRRQNKAVRKELRRNVMLQGMRWIGHDLRR